MEGVVNEGVVNTSFTFSIIDHMNLNSSLKQVDLTVFDSKNPSEKIKIGIKPTTYNSFGKGGKVGTNKKYGPREKQLVISVSKHNVYVVVEQLNDTRRKKLRKRLQQGNRDEDVHFKVVSGGDNVYTVSLVSFNDEAEWCFLNELTVEPDWYRFEIYYDINNQGVVHVDPLEEKMELRNSYDATGCACERCKTQASPPPRHCVGTVPVVVLFNNDDDARYLKMLADVAMSDEQC